jgi:hypothetical protein
MIEPRGKLDLSQESIRTERCGEIRVENLQCDETLVLSVLSEIDGSHSSTTELSVNRIGLREGISKLVERKRCLAHIALAIV